MQFYVRLLTYNEAEKLISFVNTHDRGKNTYDIQDVFANITVGGVSVMVGRELKSEDEILKCEELAGIIKNYVESNFERYEFSDIAPWKVEQQIVKQFKEA